MIIEQYIWRKSHDVVPQTSVEHNRLYGQRSGIEEFFHFLKTVLGWKDMPILDWAGHSNTTRPLFFIGGYFYEIDSALVHNQTVQKICHLGGGKGMLVRPFFLRGLSTLMLALECADLFLTECHHTRRTEGDV